MDINGYIKIYRTLLDWEWYDDSNTKIVFLHLLLNANWRESKYHGYIIPRGGLVIGLESLSKTLGISIQSIRTSLNHLKSTNEITIKSTNKFSIVTIVNWEKYQGCDDDANKQTNKQLTNEQQTTNKQLTTEEEYKNIRKEEYYIWAQEKYNSICTNLKSCKVITKNRMEALDNLFNAFNRDEIEDVFKKANDNPWLTGNNEMKWKADFDWLIDIDHFVRVQEGRYDDIKKKGFDANKGLSTSGYDFAALEKETKERRQ